VAADTSRFQDFLDLVDAYQLGDLASLLALLITIVGFGLALWRIWRSEKASELARRAAESVREQILQMSAVQSLDDVIRTLEDIRRLHRLQAWPVLPDRYTWLKRELMAIRGRTPNLTNEQRSTIQGTIFQVSTIERDVETAMTGADAPAVNRINDIISQQIDELTSLLVELQKEIERPRQQHG